MCSQRHQVVFSHCLRGQGEFCSVTTDRIKPGFSGCWSRGIVLDSVDSVLGHTQRPELELQSGSTVTRTVKERRGQCSGLSLNGCKRGRTVLNNTVETQALFHNCRIEASQDGELGGASERCSLPIVGLFELSVCFRPRDCTNPGHPLQHTSAP